MNTFSGTRRLVFLMSTLLLLNTTVGCAAEEEEETAQAPAASSTAAPAAAAEVVAGPLNPLPGREASVPALTDKTTIRMATTSGDLVIEVYPQAAPNAVQRFVELVESGFYDNTPISRVVPGFVAQFGVNWRQPHKAWEEMPFDDDPSLFALERGTLAFAKAGPDSNSTQVFINYAENNRLAARAYNFTAFGKIIEGMEVVDMFVEVGEPGMGLDQERLWEDGETYLNELAVKPTMIEHAEVVK
jgi:peptidyl-prolyl cis-trans isomerase A (cyclophilin A)